MNVKMYSSEWCPDCRRAKHFLDEHGIEYSVINVDQDAAAEQELLNKVGKRAVPQLVIDGEWFQPYRPGMGLLYDELNKRFGITQV
jgi:glutaredoxin